MLDYYYYLLFLFEITEVNLVRPGVQNKISQVLATESIERKYRPETGSILSDL